MSVRVVLAYAQRGRGGPYNVRVLTTLEVVRRDRLHHFRNASPKPGASYRLGTGHLPEFQPVTDYAGAVAFLADNPFAVCVEVAS